MTADPSTDAPDLDLLSELYELLAGADQVPDDVWLQARGALRTRICPAVTETATHSGTGRPPVRPVPGSPSGVSGVTQPVAPPGHQPAPDRGEAVAEGAGRQGRPGSTGDRKSPLRVRLVGLGRRVPRWVRTVACVAACLAGGAVVATFAGNGLIWVALRIFFTP